MVAGDGHVRIAAHERDAGARVGAVADDVARAPEAVDWALRGGVGKHGLEGGQVGVNVGGDDDAHGSQPAALSQTSILIRHYSSFGRAVLIETGVDGIIGGVKVSELGEFGLIERIREELGRAGEGNSDPGPPLAPAHRHR